MAQHDPTSPQLHSEVIDERISNVFCFRAFADKNTGILYNDMTGNFPFMSLDGSVLSNLVPL